jgi:hypothetical protein
MKYLFILILFGLSTQLFAQSGKDQFDVKENKKKAEDFKAHQVNMPKGYTLLVFESKVKLQLFASDDKAALIKTIDSLGTYLVYTKKLANSIIVSNEKSGNIKELIFGKEKTLSNSLPELVVGEIKYYEVVPNFIYELQKKNNEGAESGKKDESDVLLKIYTLPSDLKFEVICKNKDAITAKTPTLDGNGTKVFLKDNGKYELEFKSAEIEPLKLNFDVTEGMSRTNFFSLTLNASHFITTKLKSKFESADDNLKKLYTQYPCLLDDFFVEVYNKEKYSVKNLEDGPVDYFIDTNGFIYDGKNPKIKRKSCKDNSDEKFSCFGF